MLTSYTELIAELAQARLLGGLAAPANVRSPARPRVDLVRQFIRRWQYTRHYGRPSPPPLDGRF
jgi:hypothetical protein